MHTGSTLENSQDASSSVYLMDRRQRSTLQSSSNALHYTCHILRRLLVMSYSVFPERLDFLDFPIIGLSQQFISHFVLLLVPKGVIVPDIISS